MAKSKWNQIKEKLLLVESWTRDGLTDEQIANNLGISKDTFYKYKKEHTDFSDSLKRGKEIVDYQVENALLKRALGYQYKETTTERVYNTKKEKYEMVVTKEVVKEVQPDTTAQIFWLKNRKPKEWRDKQQIEHSGEINNPFKELSTEELRQIVKNDRQR